MSAYVIVHATIKDPADRGAFFGSVHHTLNHILVVDRLWAGRIKGAAHGIHALDQILFGISADYFSHFRKG